jgi:hypothetical protein
MRLVIRVLAVGLSIGLAPTARPEIFVYDWVSSRVPTTCSTRTRHLAAVSGRRREAIDRFERALGVHHALRSPPWVARSARALEETRASKGPMRLVS